MKQIDYAMTRITVRTLGIALIAMSTLLVVPQTAHAQSEKVVASTTSVTHARSSRLSVQQRKRQFINAEATVAQPSLRAQLGPRKRQARSSSSIPMVPPSIVAIGPKTVGIQPNRRNR